jgi:5-formyltetrahydrofolate cyclo-ligase
MKAELRKAMKRKLEAMAPESAAEKGRAACEALLALEAFRAARAVMLYLPLPLEVDTGPVARAAWGGGKTVLVPKVDYDERHMIAVRCETLEDEMRVDRYGILQPVDGEPWPLSDIDLVVVPALAFDRRGHRLGHGAGFYDRFLAGAEPGTMVCGLAFAEQVVEELPVRAHDHRLHVLVTDREVLTFD